MKKLVAVYALAAGIMIEVGAMGAGIELAKLDNENIDLYGIEQTAADTDRPVIVAQRRSVQEGTDELMRNAFLDRGLALLGGLLIGAGAGVLLKW
ncbi:MAG: hypothetical protein U1E66_09805 [Rhodospirillales bacterium]